MGTSRVVDGRVKGAVEVELTGIEAVPVRDVRLHDQATNQERLD